MVSARGTKIQRNLRRVVCAGAVAVAAGGGLSACSAPLSATQGANPSPQAQASNSSNSHALTAGRARTAGKHSQATFGLATQIPDWLTSPVAQGLRAHLNVTEARLVVPYDVLNPGATWRYGCNTNPDCQPVRLRTWVTTAESAGFRPFLVLGPSEVSSHAPSVSSYTASFKRMVEAFPSVHKWGAWNEPDTSSNPTRHRPKLAADYWIAGHRALSDLNRPDQLVAGEFSVINRAAVQPRGYFSQYKKEIERQGLEPYVWSFHAYTDVIERSTRETRLFLSVTPSWTSVDLTEEGVLLHPYGVVDGRAGLQRQAARTFLRLASLSPRIIGADYYQALPKPGGWDTSLVDQKGRYRPAYCVLTRLPASNCTGSSLAQ